MGSYSVARLATPDRIVECVMAQHKQLTAASAWVELVATTDDWDAADPALLKTMLNQLVLIRTFEEYVLELAGAGLVHGPAHSSIGQEGGAVGSILALTCLLYTSPSPRD